MFRVSLPFDFLGEVHDDGEDGEKAEAAGEEGVGLHADEEEYVGVEAGEEAADDERRAADAQHAGQVEGDEADGHHGGEGVGEGEAGVLGGGEKQRVEQAQGKAHEKVLRGVDVPPLEHFREETDDEREDDDEEGVLRRPGGLLVLVHGQQQAHSEKGGEDGLADVGVVHVGGEGEVGVVVVIGEFLPADDGLGIVAVEFEHLPFGGESRVAHFALAGEKGPGEAGRGTVGSEARFRDAPERGEEQMGGASQVEGDGKWHGAVRAEEGRGVGGDGNAGGREGVGRGAGIGGDGGVAPADVHLLANAAEVADADVQRGVGGPQVVEVCPERAEIVGGERAAERDGSVVDHDVVYAPSQLLGLQRAGDFQRLGQVVDMACGPFAFAVLVGVGDGERGAGQDLAAAPRLPHFGHGFPLPVLPLADEGVNEKHGDDKDDGENADEKDLRFSSIDLETDEKVYDVDVYYNNMEYEFKVDAHDGEVVYTNYTPSNDTGNTNGQGNVNGDVQGQPVVDEGITIDEAKALVLQDNNLTENDVQFTKADRDYDNNNLVYDIEFVYNNVEYNYEVRAIDGQIISFEQDDAH